jgi:multidrug efflux system membrane fusion protein
MNPNHKPLACIVVFLLLLAVAGCSRAKVESANRPPVPVRVATVVRRTVPLDVRVIGAGEAYSTVSIKAQVSGELVGVHFREGDFVKKGQLLFTIDRRPFDAALQQAEANLARDKAQATNARQQAQRYEKLYQEGVASREQYDQLQTSADAADAAVRADEAAVAYAKLQLQYCFIYSPIDGRTGSLMVHVGNLVKANDVPILLVINQINPIYVNFSVPEDTLAEVKKYMAAGPLKVRAIIPDDPQHPEQGLLSFVDNAVDNTTGTIKLKGTFPNANRRLWPGQFVNVVLTLAEQRDAIVVPSQAVQNGQEGQYVFVVKADDTAEARPVVVGRRLEAETIILKGVVPGERVVTDGQLGLVSGAKVEIKASLSGDSGTRS